MKLAQRNPDLRRKLARGIQAQELQERRARGAPVMQIASVDLAFMEQGAGAVSALRKALPQKFVFSHRVEQCHLVPEQAAFLGEQPGGCAGGVCGRGNIGAGVGRSAVRGDGRLVLSAGALSAWLGFERGAELCRLLQQR